MAVVTRYVNTASTAGGDGTTNGTAGATRAYATLTEWESSEQTDLVTATDTHIVNCTGTAADTSKFSLTGWTTDATYFITINGENTTGKISTSHYRLSFTTTSNFYYSCIIDADYTVINDMQLQLDVDHIGANAYRVTGDFVDLNRCIVKGIVATSMYGTGFLVSTADGGSATNCLAYDFTLASSLGFDINLSTSTNKFIVDNCTAYDCYTGFTQGFQDANYRNCISQLGNDGFGGSANSRDYCVSDVSGDDVGANGSIGTVSFVDAANDDYTPASGDTLAKGQGQDLSGTFTDDLTGTTRSTWDVGCLIAAASASSALLLLDS